MKRILYFITFLGATALVSCHNDPDPPIPSVDEAEMVRQLKEFTYFKEGSYWVYEDSATGDLDSMFVHYADDGEGLNSDNEKYYWFNCFIYSTRDSFEYHYTFHSSWSTSNPYRSFVFREKTKPGDNVGQTRFVDFPFVLGRYFFWSYDSIQTHDVLDSVTLSAETYHDIAIITHTNDDSEQSPTEYWVAQNVGIIRYEVADSNRIWRLVRKHIVP